MICKVFIFLSCNNEQDPEDGLLRERDLASLWVVCFHFLPERVVKGSRSTSSAAL